MEEKDWKEYRDAIYNSNISPELTGKIMVTLDSYFKLLQDLDIDTVQGARSYLISNGINVDESVRKGKEFINKLLNEKRALAK